MRVPQPSFAPPVAPWSASPPAPPCTRGAFGFPALARASSIMTFGSSMPRLTGEATKGLPANRARSRTSTSVAKITASAAAIVAGSSLVKPAEPWVSTWRSTPMSSAA